MTFEQFWENSPIRNFTIFHFFFWSLWDHFRFCKDFLTCIVTSSCTKFVDWMLPIQWSGEWCTHVLIYGNAWATQKSRINDVQATPLRQQNDRGRSTKYVSVKRPNDAPIRSTWTDGNCVDRRVWWPRSCVQKIGWRIFSSRSLISLGRRQTQIYWGLFCIK